MAVLVAGVAGCGGRSAGEPVSSGGPPEEIATTGPGAAETGTTSAPPLPGVVEGAMATPDGRERTYRLYVPPGLAEGEAVPLLVALHGGTGSGAQFAENSGFDAVADREGFIVVYPDGTPIAGTRALVWNGGACCGPAREDLQDVDDVGFLSALIEALVAGYPVDADRVYVTGHSNGAIMSYRMACEAADRVTAAAFQAGTIEIGDCDPARPISVLAIHGTGDTSIPIDGGSGQGLTQHPFASPQESIATMARLDGCDATPVESVDPENPDVTHRVWSGCDGGVTVELLLVEGASHSWMGHPAPRFLAEPYADLDASATVWEFLAAHG
ncbi:MAG: polyhydroxybutyrate depolymerase [Actinobacteria bacterium]|nr:polyhydroxybutyrate depolymerase [Actinomycetota bacterium]